MTERVTSDAAAERSAHVSRGTQHGSNLCCVCGRDVNVTPSGKDTCSYAARVVPPLLQVCSRECSLLPPFHVEHKTC